MKPTYGRVSRRGVFPNTFTMDHIGPMTRSAEDIALMLQVIAGFDPEDPGSEDCPVPDYRAALDGGVKGLRIGLVEGWHEGDGAHPDLGAAIAGAVAVLRGSRRHSRAGASCRACATTPIARRRSRASSSIRSIEPDLRTRPQDFGRILRNRVLPGALIRGEDYLAALRWRTALAKEQAAVMKRVDALITAARAPSPTGRSRPARPPRQHAEHHHAVQHQRRAGAGDPVRVQPRREHAAVAADRRRADAGDDRSAHRPRLPASHRLAPPPSGSGLRSPSCITT
jgi:Asp-tRNA(Asn)/Glu-tRNA(Gln) amidotransferase A subunit family amidase